jgi:D-alanyl-D-alanine carboxypeptidase
LKIQAAAVPTPGSADPIKPIVVRTLSVRRGPAAAAPAESAAAEPIATRQVASAGDPTVGLIREAPVREATARETPTRESKATARATHKGEWVIQIGALPSEALAQDRLKEAQNKGARLLTRAEPFTERVTKGETTLFRARFAGFDRSAAEAACSHLKRNEIACLALKN